MANYAEADFRNVLKNHRQGNYNKGFAEYLQH